jgi:hypothetical protein
MAKKKKEKVFQHGIEITKPWSKEMYAHNDTVATEVRDEIWERWAKAVLDANIDKEGAWEYDATEEMVDIQTAVTCYGFGFGHSIGDVEDEFIDEMENLPYYRLNQVVEDLEIELEEGFVGFK